MAEKLIARWDEIDEKSGGGGFLYQKKKKIGGLVQRVKMDVIIISCCGI